MYLSNILKPPILTRFRQQNLPEIQMASTICLNSLSAPKRWRFFSGLQVGKLYAVF